MAFTPIGHQLRLGHQAGAEGAALHPFAGAAAVQVDLVVAPARGQPRAVRQVGGLAAAQLQRDRVFAASKSRCRGTSPCSSAPVVTISVYSRCGA
jgi:hypothetical protein